MLINRTFLTAYLLLIAVYLVIEIHIIGLQHSHYSVSPLAMRDFANYWIAGKAYFDNAILSLFDQRTFISLLRDEFGADYPWHNWSYPPSYLFIAVPLYLLPYELALPVFLLGTMLLFYLAAYAYLRFAATALARAIWTDPLFAILLTAVVVTNIRFAQNGFLTSALLLAAFAFWRRHPVFAGIALGILTIKPHLGILIPLFLLIDRSWTAIIAAVTTAVILVLLSSLVFGIQSWLDYVTITIPYQSHVLTEMGGDGIFLSMMFSAYTAARLAGFEGSTPWLIHAFFFVPALFLALWTFLAARTNNSLRAFAAIVLGSFVASPYLFNYDAPVLSAVCAALAWQQREHWRKLTARTPSARTGLAELRFRLICLVPALPILSQILAVYVFPLTPAILLLCLTVISPLPEYLGQWRLARKSSPFLSTSGKRDPAQGQIDAAAVLE